MLKNLDDFEIFRNEEIGEGAYSKVLKVQHKETSALYALKTVILLDRCR